MKKRTKNKSVFSLCLFLLILAFPFLVEAVNLEIGIGNFTETDKITEYIGNFYLFATGLVGGFAVIMIVIGGIQYATAAGNQKGISSAKETITSAIVGLVVVALTFLILGVFGTQFTNLQEPGLPEVDAGQVGKYLDCVYDTSTSDPGDGICQYVDGYHPNQCGSKGSACNPDEPKYTCKIRNGTSQCVEDDDAVATYCNPDANPDTCAECEARVRRLCNEKPCCAPLYCMNGHMFFRNPACYHVECDKIENSTECHSYPDDCRWVPWPTEECKFKDPIL